VLAARIAHLEVRFNPTVLVLILAAKSCSKAVRASAQRRFAIFFSGAFSVYAEHATSEKDKS